MKDRSDNTSDALIHLALITYTKLAVILFYKIKIVINICFMNCKLSTL